ncbi:MAG: hypothetical protein ABIJ40_01225 [Bacteroidota bacterium]
MRLSESQIEAIKSSVLGIDENAQVYLFGSRKDPAKKEEISIC